MTLPQSIRVLTISRFLKPNNSMTYATSMKTKTTAIVAGSLVALGAVMPAFALDVNVSAGANARVGSTTVGAKAAATLQTRIANAKSRAEQEITRRVTSLNGLGARIHDMGRIVADQKAAFAAAIQTQINALTALQAKISADADLDTLKADIKSITEMYRIYMLVLPQININAAADRIQNATEAMTTLSSKLSTRIDEAKAASKDVATLQVNLTDMNTRIASANTQAAAAISMTAGLKPDNGDKAVEASSKAALKDARVKLQAARADLVVARKDAGTIVKALKAMHLDASANASTSVSTH